VESAELVATLWRRIEARDWDGVGELLAEDFVCEWPHSRERIRGRQNFVELNRNYPEGWSIEVLRVVADGNRAVSEIRVPHPALGAHYAASFFEVEAGRLARLREYWVEEGQQKEPPSDRAQWVEPLDTPP
jgi:ketosteroid isomerase-like protein